MPPTRRRTNRISNIGNKALIRRPRPCPPASAEKATSAEVNREVVHTLMLASKLEIAPSLPRRTPCRQEPTTATSTAPRKTLLLPRSRIPTRCRYPHQHRAITTTAASTTLHMVLHTLPVRLPALSRLAYSNPCPLLRSRRTRTYTHTATATVMATATTRRSHLP